MFVRLPDIPNVAHSLPVGSRLNLFWELGKPWGAFILGSTNVEGGLHSPFLVKIKLDRVTQEKKIHQLMDKMQSSQFKISGLLQLTFLGSQNYTAVGDLF